MPRQCSARCCRSSALFGLAFPCQDSPAIFVPMIGVRCRYLYRKRCSSVALGIGPDKLHNRQAMMKILASAGVCIALGWSTSSLAQPGAFDPALTEIIVTGKKIVDDELVSRQVATALHSDPNVLDDHITVTVKNGIVTLHGIALDYWDVRAMRRLSRRVAGVKRVVDDIDVRLGGE